MAAVPAGGNEPAFEGGAQPIPERPPDQPGRGRGVVIVVAVVLALLVLVLPIAWFAGALAGLAGRVSGVAMIALWVGWAIIAAIFLWMLVGMWRRAA